MRDRPVARPLPIRDIANTQKNAHYSRESKSRFQVAEGNKRLKLRGSCFWRNIINAIKLINMNWAKNKGSIERHIYAYDTLSTAPEGLGNFE